MNWKFEKRWNSEGLQNFYTAKFEQQKKKILKNIDKTVKLSVFWWEDWWRQ